MISAREAAFRTLCRVFHDGAYSNLALREVLTGDMQRDERALAASLVYGVIAHHYTLIGVVEKYSSVKPKKLARNILIILEMGIYQILYADKIPESAAVNESVKLAKRHGRHGSERLVNAVLREFCRCGGRAVYPEGETAEYLSARYSYPPGLAERWLSDFGFETAKRLMEALNEPPALMLRANTLKLGAAELIKRLGDRGIAAEPEEGALIRAEGFDIARSDLYLGGYFTVQDKGAYNAAIALDPKPGETVMDMCAAPGGKTTHIAELQGDKGRILAFDIRGNKLGLIGGAARRLGLTSIEVGQTDASVFDERFFRTADRVLCDVPCSGWGIIRRKPDIKLYDRDISALPALQSAILENGAAYLKRGGSLVYSTCTINRGENEDVTGAFLKTHGNFEKVYEKTFLPYTDGSDGFYICKMLCLT